MKSLYCLRNYSNGKTKGESTFYMSKLSLAQFLNTQMEELGLNNSAVAKRAKISRQTWYRLLNADVEEAKVSTLIRVAEALNTHVIYLLRLYFSNTPIYPTDNVKKEKVECSGSLVDDITYPHNSTVYTNEVFTKTWRVINTGTTAWENMTLVCRDEELVPSETCPYPNFQLLDLCLSPHQRILKIPYTKAGKTADISINFTAPSHPCTVVSEWQIADQQGITCSKECGVLHCIVKVISL